jgi:outer membrane protein OmpA-like peptidoglycan-associated protein
MIQSCGDPCGCGKQSLDSALISVSQNGRKYIDLGIIKSKESKKYDFEDFRVAEKIHFVKVTGLSAQEFPYGFELMNLIAFKQKPVLVRMEKELIEKEDIVPVYATEHFILPDLLFEFNSSTINQSQQSMLDSVYTRITEVVVDKISILGHTDARGDEDYNMKLSNERAQSVKVYLLQKGVDQNLIITKGYGENMLLPKIDNLDLRNRRVEIEITIRK